MKNIYTVLILLSALFGYVNNVHSQTNVGGNYFTNQTWSMAGNPYVVTSAIAIPAGVKLTIQPGVEIQNAGNFTITISGELVANGISAFPIISSGGSIMFRKTNLANSQISYFNSTGTKIQLANENMEDNPKNSDTLRVSNSNFVNTNLSTSGYLNTAVLRISSSTIVNSEIKGYYPNSEPIEIVDCDIMNSIIYLEAYNFGIHLQNCSLNDITLIVEGCGGDLSLNNCTVLNSSFGSGSGCFGGGYAVLKNSIIINTPISDIQNTDVQNCIFKYHSGITLNLGYTAISNSSFIGNFNCNGGTGIESMSGSLTNITVINNSTAVEGNFGTIAESNFFNNTNFSVKHTGTNNVTATGNYWGTVSLADISNLVYDYWDDISLGTVDYSGFVNTPNIECPISPPINISKTEVAGGVFLSWNPNNESDVAGYKIYYGTTDGVNFTNSIDVGNVSYYVLNGLSENDAIFITAYDNLADGIEDMVEGHESWYSDDIIPNANISNAATIELCEGTSATLNANNYPNIHYQWQQDGTNTGIDAASLSVNLPGNYRVIETNLNGCSDTSNTIFVIVNPLPSYAETITGLSNVCQGQNSVVYTLPSIDNATSYLWTLPNGAIGNSSTNSITINYDASAVSGNIIAQGINSCGAGAITTLPIMVNQKPTTPIITMSGLVLHSVAPTGNQWYDQNGILNGETSQSFTVTNDGDYYVIVTLLNCASEPSNTINVTLTEIEWAEANNAIKVYPNPVTTDLNIEIEGNTENLSFEILDAVGQVIFKSNFVEKAAVHTSTFSPGVYLIKIKNGQTSKNFKVIKQ